MAEVTYSPTVQSAISDPEGVRRALWRYGEQAGWPAGSISPIPCGEGIDAWRHALVAYPPVWLGQAWERIERQQRTAVKYKRPEGGMPQSQVKGPNDMPVIQPSTGGSMLDPGFYRATISEIVEKESTFDGKVTQQFQFQFVVLDGDSEKTDLEIRGWCSQKWHEKAKLYEWSKAILGRKCPAATDPFDTDKLLNKKVDIEVVPNPKPDRPDATKIAKLYPFGSMTKEEDDDAA
jgi:hypothetical protein